MLEVWLAGIAVMIIAQTWLFSVLVKGLSTQIERELAELRQELAEIIDKMLESGVNQEGISPVAAWFLQNIANQHQTEPREIEPKT